VDNLGQWILARLRLRATWLAMVAWLPLVTPLVGQLVTQVLLRRRLMQLMPLSALQWTEPPPKVARLVPMQVLHKQMTMGRVLQLKKLWILPLILQPEWADYGKKNYPPRLAFADRGGYFL